MNPPPFPAEIPDRRLQRLQDLPYLPPREFEILHNLHRPTQAVQLKFRLTSAPHNVYMRRAVIVRVNPDVQPLEHQNRRHDKYITKPNRLGSNPSQSPSAVPQPNADQSAVASAKADSNAPGTVTNFCPNRYLSVPYHVSYTLYPEVGSSVCPASIQPDPP